MAKYYDWAEAAEMARVAQIAGSRAKKHRRKCDEASAAPSPIHAPVHRTADTIATAAGTSRRKADQVIFVAKNKPELLDDVLAGKATLLDAERLAREAVGKLRAKRDAWDLGGASCERK